ncbi:MAG: type II secretion system protein N [Pseudomonadales bacterium]|nr:type II secretion system protein N [Pseudomonadales bacterium]
MIGKRYLLLGGVAYFVFLIATLPAGVAWKYFVGLAEQPGLEQSVSQLRGSAWNGEARVYIEGISYPVSWRVSPRSIWRLRLELDLSSYQDLLDGDATAFISPFGLGVLDVRAKFSPGLINHFLKPLPASMSNPVYVNVQRVDWNWGAFIAANGRVAWEGGLITYRVGRDDQEFSAPEISASLSSHDGHLVLAFLDGVELDAEELVSARLSGKGLGVIQVRRRLLDLIGQRWAANSQAEDIIFEVSQKLWN